GFTIVHRICPIEQLAISEAPSICRWNTIDISNLVPNILCILFQNLEVNFESQSDTIDSGSPCNWTISLMYSDASSEAFDVVFIEIRWTIEVSLHMITHRLSSLLDLWNGPMKSMPIDPHSLLGIGSGCRRPTSLYKLDLHAWQTQHVSQNFSTSGPSLDHQYQQQI